MLWWSFGSLEKSALFLSSVMTNLYASLRRFLHASTRKLDRLKACTGSNYGWSTDSLVTGLDKYAVRQTKTGKLAFHVAHAARLRQASACSRNTQGRPAAYLVTKTDKHSRKPDRSRACSESNCGWFTICLLYTSPSPRDRQKSRMPSSA